MYNHFPNDVPISQEERRHKSLVKVLDKIAQALFAISDSLDKVADAKKES